MNETKDYMIRATAADGFIRAFAATTRNTVETARQHHNTSPVATAALGRLMTAALMMGYDMKNDPDLLTIRSEDFWSLRTAAAMSRAMSITLTLCFRRTQRESWMWEARSISAFCP